MQRGAGTNRLYSQDVDLLRIVASLLGSVLLSMPAPFAALPADHDSERLRQLCASHGIIGNSPALLAAVKQIDNAKHSHAPIMLLGESGTGKEMFAQMIHRLSPRAKGAYIPINCGAIPGQLLESELFGHEKGSFTGAHKHKKGKLQQADGGTLFLDEIGDMQLDLQVKLLRVLQDRQVEPVGGDKPVPVDFRIVTATHINLKQAVESGRFRLDLFFRLNVMPVALPPLRERRGDIPLLAEHFLQRYQGMYRRNLNFGPGALARLQDCHWPGNIRQLQNVLERAVLQGDGPCIDAGQIERILADEAELNPAVAAESPPLTTAPPPAVPSTTETPMRYRPYNRVDSRQREHIMAALRDTGGNQTRAAELLGMTTRQLRYRLAKLAGD